MNEKHEEKQTGFKTKETYSKEEIEKFSVDDLIKYCRQLNEHYAEPGSGRQGHQYRRSESGKTNVGRTQGQPKRNLSVQPISKNGGGTSHGKIRRDSVQLRVRTRNQSYPEDRRGVNLNKVPETNGKMLKKLNNKIFSQIKQVGINQTMIRNTPMPRMSLEVSSVGGGIDKVRVRGTEYLTAVTANTNVVANAATKARPGDVLFVTPINPHFFSGTRLIQFVHLYTKYKWKYLSIEYCPVVPSVQDGTLITYFSYDPQENNFLTTDENQRLRSALAHPDAKVFNVYNYALTSLVDDKQLGSYYTQLGGDVRFENQGTYYMVAGSEYSPPFNGTNPSVELGQLIMHYDIELEERALSVPLSETVTGNMAWSEVVVTTILRETAQTAIPITFVNDAIEAEIALRLKPWHLMILIPIADFAQGELTPENPINITSPDTPDTGSRLFSKGSVWYLRVSDGDEEFVFIYTSLEDAIAETNEVHMYNGLPITYVVTFDTKYWIYDLRSF